MSEAPPSRVIERTLTLPSLKAHTSDRELVDKIRREAVLIMRQSKLRLLLICSVIGGCASFKPALRYSDLTKPREPTVRQTQKGLEVSIEEFASKDKSKQAFDADIARYGVLALLLRIENGGTKTYWIRATGVSASIGAESLPSMTGESASRQGADSGYIGKALAWTLLSGPFTILPIIAGSVSHTAAVNRRIEEHCENLKFTDNLLKPNQTATGFFYFKLPSQMKRLENLRVEVTVSEEQTGNELSYKFSLSTFNP